MGLYLLRVALLGTAIQLLSCAEPGLETRVAGTGVVEVRQGDDSTWRPICSSRWSVSEANVTCRNLGYRWGKTLEQRQSPEMPVWWDEMSCRGFESSLLECSHGNWGNSNCTGKSLLAVACYNTTASFEPRQNTTGLEHYGYLQVVAEDGQIYSVCTEQWDDVDANVACRDMGYSSGRVINNLILDTYSKPPLSWEPSHRNFNCRGNESRLADCPSSRTTYSCTRGKATAACFNDTSIIYKAEVRLRDGGKDWGRVELKYMGIWSTMCDTFLTVNLARPVCRMLGYTNGTQIGARLPGGPVQVAAPGQYVPISVLNTRCEGSETTITQCQGWNSTDTNANICDHSNDYFVYCHNVPGINYRIVGDWKNPPVFGRVEIQMNGVWGTVCNDKWNDTEATVLCKQLGFTDGVAYRDLDYGDAPEKVWVAGVQCDTKHTSLSRCPSYGWGVYNSTTSPYCTSHKHDASVSCSNRTTGGSGPRLVGGVEPNYGRVEIYSSSRWRQVCGKGFTDTEAAVVCRELGYVYAISMCCHAFGYLTTAMSDQYQFKCNGNETAMTQCLKYTQTYCPGLPSNYASVYCYNDTLNKRVDVTLKYKNVISEKHTLGIVEAKFSNLLGHVCGDDFTDVDANVTCRELGMAGGVAYAFSEAGEGPVVISQVNCTGKEGRLQDCPHMNWTTTYCGSPAGVLCHTGKPVKISLKTVGANNTGFIQIQQGNETGYICVSQLTNYDANVLCRQVGFVDGKPGYMRNNMTSFSSIYMRNIQCKGTEPSLFQCVNDGWMENFRGGCSLPGQSVAAVKCSGPVRLEYFAQDGVTEIGKVQVFQGGDWASMCSDAITAFQAKLICSDLYYPYSQVVDPLYFTNYIQYLPAQYVVEASCNGSETTLLMCKFTRRLRCDTATVVCSSQPISNKTTVEFDVTNSSATTTHGMLVLTRYGYRGRACPTDWDNNAANVACRQLGFFGGVMQKSRSYARDVSWLLNYKCSGNESDLSDCPSNGKALSCISSQIVGAICFNKNESAPKFRLVNQDIQRGQRARVGYVEVEYRGVTGTICDINWSNADAKVLCKQLNFYDGEAVSGSRYGEGAPKRFLSSLDCLGTESDIMECSTSGWEQPDSACTRGHTASVICNDIVRLDLGEQAGPVEMNINGRWGYLCDDHWTDVEAVVACRQVGFQTGKAACCSLYGKRFYYTFVARNVTCKGTEDSLQNCSMASSMYQSCPSSNYAAVVCWNYPEHTFQEVRFQPVTLVVGTTPAAPRAVTPIQSATTTAQPPATKGRIQVKFANTYGYVCGTDNWDDNAATVFCKEKAISRRGSAYRSVSVTSRIPFWISDIKCLGNESSLLQCQYQTWTNLSICNQNNIAAAICIQDKIEYRLVGGNNVSYGRVEVAVDGEWGTVCDYSWDNPEADVICHSLGFNSGVPYGNSYYGAGSGKVWLYGLECTGKEESLAQCPHEGWDSLDNGYSYNWYCRGHYDDVGVYCYGHVRLQNGEDLQFGRVEVLDKQNDTWYPVCNNRQVDQHYSNIACQQIGYQSGQAFCCANLGQPPKNGLSLVNVTCKGTETDVRQCSYTIGSCFNNNYVNLLCSNITANESASLKISMEVDGGVASYNGMLRVTMKNAFTGRVCGKNWTDANSNVACRMMGYAGGVAYDFRKQSRLPYVMGHVNCTGSERSLTECNPSALGQDSGCGYDDYDAGVLCYNSTGIKFALSQGSFGVVNITLDGQTGLVCHLGWTDREAQVLCHQLGYIDGTSYTASDYAYYNKRRWMTSLYCNGDETSLLRCRDSGWDNVPYYCSASASTAAAYCYSDVRLKSPTFLNNQVPTSGAVLVHDQGEWTLICDEEWDVNDAKVVCREMGYADGVSACCSAYGFIAQKVRFTRVRCTGTEQKLAECPMERVMYSSVENTACTYASVVCLQSALTDEYKLQLSRQAGVTNTGKVMINYASELGRVCSDGWDDKDAKVVCRELGFNSGQSYKHYEAYTDNLDSYGPWWTSNVSCNGNESRLGDCQRTPWGKVSSCSIRHAAGVLCFSTQEPVFRMSDSGGSNYGLIEVAVDGEWGSVCDISWDSADARVFCRMMGFADGQPSSKYGRSSGPIWMSYLQCEGNEASLTRCVHSGWKTETRTSCIYHYRDAGVFCYKPVRMYDGTSASLQMSVRAGALLYYSQALDKWMLVCDSNDTNPDVMARKACKEMGFYDGRAIRRSAYGYFSEYAIMNGTLRCKGDETDITKCYQALPQGCSSNFYLSLICIDNQTYSDTVYNISLESNKSSSIVTMAFLNQPALICADNWNDADARVLCRSMEHEDGIAYYHSIGGTSGGRVSLPYVVSNFSCTGNESSLLDCAFDDRLTMSNCSAKYAAGVFCFKSTAVVQWRLAGGPAPDQGRVELKLGDTWGTLCDASWDNKDAMVLCRQLNYYDGQAFSGAKYGEGNGTVWLSQIHCTGTESNLLKCPHMGFNTSQNEAPILRWDTDSLGTTNWPNFKYCFQHSNDASVFCFGAVKLSNGANTSFGAVQVYKKDYSLYAVCDDHWTDVEAGVVCKSLGFMDGRAIPNSGFGKLDSPIGLRGVFCKGNEKSLLDCDLKWDSNCSSGSYGSVYCTNKTITQNETEPMIRIIEDEHSSHMYGMIEARIKGVWGRVCLQSFGEAEANVTCRMLGYAGGTPYLHIARVIKPIIMSNMDCNGGESSLFNCRYQLWSSPAVCPNTEQEAGVVCYNTSGIKYRLAGQGSNSSQGRAEIQYEGQWGTICNLAFGAPDARVFCASLGFQDGQTISPNPFGSGSGPIWLETLSCVGNESSPLTCISSGFNSSWESFNFYQCSAHSRDAAVHCYENIMRLTKVRLAGGTTANEGRVEVYVTEAEGWGTVCDDSFDDNDAKVICRMLNFTGGKVLPNSAFGEGTGYIWLDDLDCQGTETTVMDCTHPGLGHTNCFHFEDVAISCVPAETTTLVPPEVITVSMTRTSTLTTKPTRPSTTGPVIPFTTTPFILPTSQTTLTFTSPKRTSTSLLTTQSTGTRSENTQTASTQSTSTQPTSAQSKSTQGTSTQSTSTQSTSTQSTSTQSTSTQSSSQSIMQPTASTLSTTTATTDISTGISATPPVSGVTANLNKQGLVAAIVVPIVVGVAAIALILAIMLHLRKNKKTVNGHGNGLPFSNLTETPGYNDDAASDMAYEYRNQLYEDMATNNNIEEAHLTQNELPPSHDTDVKLKNPIPSTDDSHA